MHSFKNDYSEGAHPRILDALVRNNPAQEEGYGEDRHSREFARIVRELVGSEEAGVHLIPGGTQTNLLAISSFLRPHEACIAADSGHISTHEAGAIEGTGHKILCVPGCAGKLTPALIEPVLEEHHFEHMVKPRLVYISQSTEMGTVYTKEELEGLHEFCRSRNLYLYADGARLGAALATETSAVGLQEMYELTDAFFIGGTKNGALFGEALILNNSSLKGEFRYLIKQRGALLAKGWITGLQFRELFRDSLYMDLARRANGKAQGLAAELRSMGCDFLVDSPTNQIFPILENHAVETLLEEFAFYPWQGMDDHRTAVRLITSWATPQDAVDRFAASCRSILNRS